MEQGDEKITQSRSKTVSTREDSGVHTHGHKRTLSFPLK